jgi:hypothetical protein
MDNVKLIEKNAVSEETTGVQSETLASTLVDMGQVSKETHGFVHGLEYAFLPKS